MGEAAAFVSAISALVVILFTIIVFYLTRRKERPVISLIKSKVESSVETEYLYLEFKNIGKNPALKVKIHMYSRYRKGPLTVKKVGSMHIVNQKDPGLSFLWQVEVKVPDYRADDYIETADFLFYIGLTYEDIFTKKHYLNELWLILRTEKDELTDMDVKDYCEMKKAVEEIPFYQDLHKKPYKIIRRKEKT